MKFKDFLNKVENSTFPITVNAKGLATIQQTVRNKLRAEGQQALFEDLKELYPDYDCLLTADGIVFVSPNKDFEFSFQLKTTVPSIDYDAYEEADAYARAEQIKKEKAEKKAKEQQERIKRQQELRAQYKSGVLILGDEDSEDDLLDPRQK